jgi:hypothetical protein
MSGVGGISEARLEIERRFLLLLSLASCTEAISVESTVRGCEGVGHLPDHFIARLGVLECVSDEFEMFPSHC